MTERAQLEHGRYLARTRYPELGLCERCCSVKAHDRHHKDGDTFNNAPENVAFLCRRCHMIEDGRLEMLAANKVAPERRRQSTHCDAGHTFDEQNTRWHKGRRHCRKCHAERAAKSRQKKRDERRQLPGQWKSGRWWPEESSERLMDSVRRRTS